MGETMIVDMAERPPINRYPVLAWLPVDGEEIVILCDRGETSWERYVTAKYIPGQTEWMFGNYFVDKDKAMISLATRAGFPLAFDDNPTKQPPQTISRETDG